MRNPLLTLVASNTGVIFTDMGITKERVKEILDEIDTIIKSHDGEQDPMANAIVDVWNHFENDNECALAMFSLRHEEDKLTVHHLFKLPEAVVDRVVTDAE